MGTYYISPSGTDSSNAGSSSNPWRTFPYAFGRLSSGDTLKMKNGTWRGGSSAKLVGKSNVTIEPDTGATPIWDLQNTGSIVYDGAAIYITGGSGNVLDGITIKNCLGRGIYANAVTSVTIKNCATHDTGRQGIAILRSKTSDAKLMENCTVSRACQRPNANGKRSGAGMQIRLSNYVTVRNCRCYDCFVDGLIGTVIQNCTYEQCIAYGNDTSNFYIEQGANITVNRCAVFGVTGGFNSSTNFVIKQEQSAVKTRNVTVTNSIFIGTNCASAAVIINLWQVTNEGAGAGVDGIDFCNNYIYGGDAEGIIWGNNSQYATTSYFVNNVIIKGSRSIFSIRAGNGAKCTFSHNAWSHNPGQSWAVGTNSLIASSGDWNTGTDIVDYNAAISRNSDFDADNYKIVNGNLNDVGTNGSVTNTEDYWGATRPFNVTRDIGAHELSGAAPDPTLAADFEVDGGAYPGTAESGDTVVYTDNTAAGGGASVERRKWQFWTTSGGEPNEISYEAAPSVTYPNRGEFRVIYEVFDDTNNVHSVKDVDRAVTITSLPTDVEPILDSKLLTFDTDDTALAHGMTPAPSAGIFVLSNTKADETPAGDAHLSIGLYGSSNQASIVGWSQNAMAAKETGRSHDSDQALQLYAPPEEGVPREDEPAAYGTVTVDDTNVNFDFLGVTDSETGWALLLGGAAIIDAEIHKLEFSAAGTQTVTSNANLLIAITNNKPYEWQVGGALWSLGVALKDDNQACMMLFDPRINTTTSSMRSGAIGYFPSSESVAEHIATFGAGNFSIRCSTEKTAITVLAIRLHADVGAALDIIDTPITGAIVDYSLGFTPGTLFGIQSNVRAVDSDVKTDDAGFFGVVGMDGTDTQSTVVYIDPAPSSDTVTGTVTDNAWIQYDQDGTQTQKTAVTLGANKFSLNQDDVLFDTTARKALVLSFEATSTGTDPIASFVYDFPDPSREYIASGDTVQFRDLSVASGVRTITGWAWEFDDNDGDAADTSALQDPTYQFNTPGNWTVRLEATDSAAATD